MTDYLNNILLLNEKNFPQRVYLRQPRQDKWHEFTWSEVMKQARQVAQFLLNKGLQRGDKVALFSKNCAEWFITDYALSLAGLVNVPLFGNQHQDSIRFVLEHAEIKLVFVGKLDDYQRVRSYIPDSLPTVGFGYHDESSVNTPWAEVLKTEPLQDIVPTAPDDIYTIIYSSGTAGLPKGAVYTHQIIANYLQLYPQDIRRIAQKDFYHLISYLPLAHVYERTAVQLGSVVIPCDVSFVESLDKFAHNLQEVQPTLFTGVPRIWGVFQQKIEAKLPPKKLDLLLKIPFISSLIKKKVRHGLGLSHCINCFSGASHLPVNIIKFFEKLGIYIQEGYGQTENLAYVTFSMLNERRPGYVGTARTQVDLKVDSSEELLVHSPCLMKEYYKDPEATKKALVDGWLHTGDVVEFDDQKRVKILGRLSENFKNRKGEFIAPSPIEKQFSTNAMIEQLCLVGRELPSNILLVTLSERGLTADKETLKNLLQKDLHQVNRQLLTHEKISHIIIANQAWTPENGLLTPTLKVKRRAVEEAYQPVIKRAIDQHQQVIWDE